MTERPPLNPEMTIVSAQLTTGSTIGPDGNPIFVINLISASGSIIMSQGLTYAGLSELAERLTDMRMEHNPLRVT